MSPNARQIDEPIDLAQHVFDKSQRTDGTFSRADFAYDQESDAYVCPAGKQLRKQPSTVRQPSCFVRSTIAF